MHPKTPPRLLTFHSSFCRAHSPTVATLYASKRVRGVFREIWSGTRPALRGPTAVRITSFWKHRQGGGESPPTSKMPRLAAFLSRRARPYTAPRAHPAVQRDLLEIGYRTASDHCRNSATRSYLNVGIVYCTCGHLLKEIAANRKFVKYTMDLLSLPDYVIMQGRLHGHRYGKKPGDKEYYLANQFKKTCKKEKVPRNQ